MMKNKITITSLNKKIRYILNQNLYFNRIKLNSFKIYDYRKKKKLNFILKDSFHFILYQYVDKLKYKYIYI